MLLALAGLPAAGKSTITRALLAREDERAVKIVSFDDDLDRAGAFDAWSPETWHAARAASLDRLRAACALPRDPHRTRPRIVVADDNNPLRSMRHELYQLARDAGWAYATGHVDCGVAECERRNAAREGRARVPDETIAKMAGELERPQPERKGWERFSVTVPGDAPDAAPAAAETLLTVVDAASSRRAGTSRRAPPEACRWRCHRARRRRISGRSRG